VIQAQQEPPAQLLIDRMVAIAHCGMRHLRDERMGIVRQRSWSGRNALDPGFMGNLAERHRDELEM